MPTERRIRKRALAAFGIGACWLLAVLGAVLLGATWWIRHTFGPISVDQMLMNLTAGGEAAPGLYARSFFWQAVVVPFALLGAVVLALVLARRFRLRWQSRSARHAQQETEALSRPRSTALRTMAAFAVFAIGMAGFAQTVSLVAFVKSYSGSVSMSDYYVAPSPDAAAGTVGVVEEKPKNLVLIFLESGEESFSDEALFGRNLNEPLETATDGWDSFDRLEAYPGNGWTMAGIVGTECGVPLRAPGMVLAGEDANEIGEAEDAYMSGAVCLGDVLSGAGYRNVFLGGADATFASKRDFLVAHGYDTVKDRSYWADELGETELAEWGLSDRRLMERAKEEITALHDSGQPFNLTLLTLDVHMPVYAHEYCPTDSDDPDDVMAEVTLCSMEQVAGFVQYMEEMGYLEDTVVMITGDHKRMIGEGRPFLAELGDLEDRPLFNRFWDPDGAKIKRSETDQLSLFPTLLESLGFGRSDGRAGVGVSALMDGSSEVGAVALGPEDYEDLLLSRSKDLYEQLWGRSAETDAIALGG